MALLLSQSELANYQSSQLQITEKRFTVLQDTCEQIQSARFGKAATTQTIRHEGSSLKVEFSR